MQRDHLVLAILLVVAAFGFLFLSVRHSTVADDGDAGLKLLSADRVQSAPDWALPDAVTGKSVRLSEEARRQPVVFSFWATWCGPCREELPHLEAVAKKYQGRVAVYGVNSNDAPPAITAFAQQNGLTFPMLSDRKRDAATSYGAESIPMMVVVDTQDKVRAVSVGYDPDGNLEASLSKVLDTLLTESRSDHKENPMKLSSLSAAALLLAAAGTASAAPAGTTAPSPLAAVENANSIQVKETILASSTTGSLEPKATLSISLSQPGKAHLEQTATGATTPDIVLVSDGKSVYQYTPAKKQYVKEDSPMSGFGPEKLPLLAKIPAGTASTDATLDGKPALLYTVSQKMGEGTVTRKLWIDPKTHLPEQQSTLTGEGDAAKEVQRVVFSDWSVDKAIPETQFAFAPPTGVKEFVPPPTPKLLAEGAAAPDFTVKDRDGKDVKLSDYKGKVVVLDFWATWCGPCQQSLPHTNEVAKAFKDKNVVVLGVNVWDKQDAFDKWLPEHKDYDSINFLIDTAGNGQDVATAKYNVSGIPTQYVIGPDGKIVKSFVGFGGPNDDLANALKAAGATS